MTAVKKFHRAKPYRRKAQDVKALVRHRDGYRCQGCGMTAREHYRRYKKALDVHRLVPGSRYTLKGCVTLCRSCHGPQLRTPRGDRVYRNGDPITTRLKPRLRAVLRAYASADRRSMTQAVILLLEEALRARKLWPPSPELPVHE